MIRTKRFRRLFKEGSWILLGQAMMVLGTLASVRMFTEFLTPAAYGELALGMTIATLVNQIILGPLGGGITRFYAPAVEQGDLASYLNAARKLVFYASEIILLIAILVAVGLIVMGHSKWIGIALLAFLFSAHSGFNAILSGIQSAARQRAIVALHQGVDPWLRLLVSIVFLLWLGATSSVVMLGYAIATLLVLSSQIYFFRKITPSNVFNVNNRKWQIEIWKFSWPFGFWGVFTCLQLASDRWALQVFSSTKDVGSYAVLYQLGYYPILLLMGMAMQFLVPILYQRAGDASDGQRNADANRLGWQLTWLSLGLTGVVFLVATLLHPLIFRILVAKEYGIYSFLFPWMIFAGGVFASGQTLASNLQAQMKIREMIGVKIVTALLGTILNFVGAYWYGMEGVVCASVLFSMLYFTWLVVLVIKSGNEQSY